jgi:hypothetical protein
MMGWQANGGQVSYRQARGPVAAAEYDLSGRKTVGKRYASTASVAR